MAADPEPDARSVARTICLRLLTVRARTRAELRDALLDRNVEVQVADEVLDRLSAVGLIDDAAFSETFVTSRQAGRGLALREITRQLRAKGISSEMAERAVTAAGTDEHEAARKLAARKLASMRGVDEQAQMRRLVGALARKGYSSGVAYGVVRELLGERAAEQLADSG